MDSRLPSYAPEINTPRLRLRHFGPADAPRVQILAGDLRVAGMTSTIPHPYPDGAAEAWIATHDADWQKHAMATWAVCTAADGFVGCFSLLTNLKHNRADLGYWFGVDYWNRGYCTEAGRPVIDFGFGFLKLTRIGAIHLAENPASGRVMQKLGLLYEGTQRQFATHRGRQVDFVHYGLLPTDPRPPALP